MCIEVENVILVCARFVDVGGQPFIAASIAAMSILVMVIIASNARLAMAGSACATASVNTRGVICHDNPHLSLHQPQALAWPPLSIMAFQ